MQRSVTYTIEEDALDVGMHLRLLKDGEEVDTFVVPYDHYEKILDRDPWQLFLGFRKEDAWEGYARRWYYWDPSVIEAYQTDPSSHLYYQDQSFQEDGPFYTASMGHLYRIHHEIPLSKAYRIDYISGFDDREFDLDQAEEILQDHPHVWDIERCDIIPQNGGGVGLEFSVRLPQDTYEELWKQSKWEGVVCAGKELGHQGVKHGQDYFGLKEALRDDAI